MSVIRKDRATAPRHLSPKYPPLAHQPKRRDPRQLNHVAAASAIWAYSIAQLPELLPRDAAAPPPAPGAASSSGISTGAIAGVSAGIGAAALAGFLIYRGRARPATFTGAQYSAMNAGAASAEVA